MINIFKIELWKEVFRAPPKHPLCATSGTRSID
jgi:hypothetical protein